jgi:hypothetical protein
MAKKRASLAPKDLATGGGLLDDCNVEFTNCRFEMFDYGGKAPEAPALHATLVDMEDGEEHEQYWSAGKASDWEIGEDGAILVPVGKATAVNVSSNLGQLLVSLGNAGFPEETLADGDVTALEGMKAHVMRIEMKRKGLKKQENDKGYEQTCLCVDEIVELPGGEAVTEDESSKGVSDEDAIKFVTDAMGKAGKVAKKDFPKIAFKLVEDDDERNEILEVVFSDEWLKENFNYAKGIVTPKE